jgi:hypothetical protein
MPDFSFRDWCVLFRVLSKPIEDLLFTIWIEGRMLSSSPALVKFVKLMGELGLDTRW